MLENTKRQNNRILTACEQSLLEHFITIFLSLSALRLLLWTFFALPTAVGLVFTGVLTLITVLELAVTVKVLDERVTFALAAAFILFAASYLMHGSGLEYSCNTIIFLGTLAVLPHARLNGRTVKAAFFILLFSAWLVASFASRDNDKGLFFSLNTNSSSFILFISQAALIVYARKQNGTQKILALLLTAALVATQLQFGGRSSLIGTALLIVYVIIRNRFEKLKLKSVRRIVIALCIGGVVFAYFYAKVLYAIIGHGEIYFLGKDLFSGRQVIWTDAFAAIKNNLLTGIGNTLMSWTSATTGNPINVHNQMLGYLTCFGLPAAIAFIAAFSLIAERLFGYGKSKASAAILIVLTVISYFETLFYSSDSIVVLPIALTVIYFISKEEYSA